MRIQTFIRLSIVGAAHRTLRGTVAEERGFEPLRDLRP